MSHKEVILRAVSNLSDDVSMEEIARKVEFLAGIEVAREQVRRGDTIPVEEVLKEMEEWVHQ